MGTERADAVIVGAGLAGSAAARALASRGRSVVLLEAFEPEHRRGSSHGSARIFRRAYPDRLYVRLTGQAQVLWRQLADEAGEDLVTTTGAVDYGPALPRTMQEIMTGFGVPAELMKAEAAPGAWPVFMHHDEIVRYGLPAGRDGEVPSAVKIGEHGRGTVTTGDGRNGIVSPAARDRVRAFVRQRLGGLDPAPVGEVTCLYTSTASEDFILDRCGPFVVCSPCSGHGAKFAPLVGEIAADLACGGASPDPRFTLAAHCS